MRLEILGYKDRYALINKVLKLLQTDPSSSYNLNYGDDFCPNCDNKTLILGDVVDFTQVTPSGCEWCGWIQRRFDTGKEHNEYNSFLRKCWELQIDPLCRNPVEVSCV